MRKKVIAILLTVTMTAAMLAGCGNSGSSSDSSTEPVQEENTEEPATEEDSATAEEAETAESEAGGVNQNRRHSESGHGTESICCRVYA